MSVNNFLLILARALEARDDRDETERRAVYETSRRTLQRYFEQNPEIDAARRETQWAELEEAIAEIEWIHGGKSAPRLSPTDADAATGTASTVPPPAPPRSQPAAPPRSQPAAPPRTDAAPPLRETARPAPPPVATVKPAPPTPPTDRKDPVAPAKVAAPAAPADAPAAMAATRPDIATDGANGSGEPAASDALFGEGDGNGDVVSPRFDDTDVGQGEGDPEKRSRRGRTLVILIVAALLVAYEAGWLEWARRLVVTGSLPKTVVHTVPAGPGDPVAKSAWSQVVGSFLADTGRADQTAAYLKFEPADGANSQELAGRMEWKYTGSGETTELNGRLSVAGSPMTMEILLGPDSESLDGFSRLAMIAFQNTPEPISGAGMLQRVEAATGRLQEADGVATRVGLDRILYGFKPIVADTDPVFDRRSLYQFSITFESGKKMRLVFRLPPP
jgi:hypothetical protein